MHTPTRVHVHLMKNKKSRKFCDSLVKICFKCKYLWRGLTSRKGEHVLTHHSMYEDPYTYYTISDGIGASLVMRETSRDYFLL